MLEIKKKSVLRFKEIEIRNRFNHIIPLQVFA